MEKHLFIIWNDSIKYSEKIINEIKSNFMITYVTKKDDILIKDTVNKEFLKEFYHNLYHENEYVNRPRYTSKFIIILINDLNPIHITYNTSQRGKILVNKNILNFKHYLRKKFDNASYPLCHTSDDIYEFIHNLKVIIKYASINNILQLLNYEINYSILYKNNEIKFLNFSTINLSENNKKMWNNYIKLLNDNYKINNEFCIESSFIMSLYNIREASDLTYICSKNIISSYDKVKNHNNIIENNSNFKKEDIIYNPKYHFYCSGFKCLNLEILKIIKTNRNTEKDKRDVKLIDNFLL